MFAPNIVTVTINDIEGGIIMFALIIATTTLLILAASVATLFVLALTDYTVARALIDAIPFDPDVIDAAIASIPGNVKRLVKATKTATKEAWHTTVTIVHNIGWAIGAISWLGAIVFAGVCDDAANLIANINDIIDAAVEHVKQLRGTIRNIIDNAKLVYGDIRRITKTAVFYAWRFGVGIKDAVKLAIDFVYAACNYIKAHTPGLITNIQVNTWNAIVRAVKAIISAAKTVARVAREMFGIFAATSKLIAWVSGGIGIDANNAMAKVANKF